MVRRAELNVDQLSGRSCVLCAHRFTTARPPVYAGVIGRPTRRVCAHVPCRARLDAAPQWPDLGAA
jgi:hypothetical protein